MATVGEGCKDITNKLENIPVSILLIPHCGCFTSTGKCAAKNCCAQILTVGFHQLVDGWNFMPIFDKNITGKIFNFVRRKNIFTSYILVDWPLNTEPVPEWQPVPGFYASTWARNLSACLCSFGQSEDSHKWQCLKTINIKISNARYGKIQLLCSDLFCLQFWSRLTTSYFNKCVTT